MRFFALYAQKAEVSEKLTDIIYYQFEKNTFLGLWEHCAFRSLYNYIVPWRENKRICRCIFIDIQRRYTTPQHHSSQSQASRSASQPITGLGRHGSNCFNERKLEQIEWMIMLNKMGNNNKKIVFIFRSIFFFTFVLSPRYDIKQK